MDMVHLIDTKYLSSKTNLKPVDLAAIISYLTFDTIGDIAFGAPFGYIKEDKDIFNYSAELEFGASIGMSIAHFPWLSMLFSSRPVRLLVGDSLPSAAKTMKYASP
jgi:hypothetical protein